MSLVFTLEPLQAPEITWRVRHVGRSNGEGPVRLEADEISRVLEIPLHVIVKTHIESGFHKRTPPTDDLEYPLKDVVVWGVTARILHYFVELLYPHIAKGRYLQE